MKLVGSTNSKITWNENKKRADVPYLKITEVLLVYCNIVNYDYQHDLRVSYTFVPIKPFGQLLDIHLKIYIFKNP